MLLSNSLQLLAWLLSDPVLHERLQGCDPPVPQLSPTAGQIQPHVVPVWEDTGSGGGETSLTT